MWTKKRCFLILIALITTAAALCSLASCRSGKGGPDETVITTESSVEQTSEETASFKEVESFKLIDKGVSSVKVIRPDDDKESDITTVTAVSIKKKLQDLTSNGRQAIGTDWTMSGEHDSEAVEILVGPTAYSEGREEIQKLGLGSYMIRAFGNKIAVYAHCTSGYEAALTDLENIFANNLSEEGSLYTLDIPRDQLASSKVFNEALNSLPFPSGSKLASVYSAGDDCEEVIFSDATSDGFSSFIDALKSAGYTLYTTNEVKDNKFATLYNSAYTVNAGYYAYSKEIRVIAEPFTKASLIGKEEDNKFTRVTTQAITMLGLEYYNAANELSSNGLSALIRLSDGRFIVIDGGFNTEAHAKEFVAAVKDQYAEFASAGNPTIAAWIITHSHGDHNGLLNGRHKIVSDGGIKVEKVICNYLHPAERLRSATVYSNNWSETEGTGYINTYKAISALGAERVVAHVGQIYYFGDLKMEVLYTLESMAPDAINAMNSTSLIIKFTFTDPSTGAQTVYMSTGDATGPGFAITNQMFGDYLKSDIVQVAHHGYTTWGNDTATKAAYKLMSPSIVLWPVGTLGFSNVKDRAYNKVIYDTATNPNFKELYVSGTLGQRTTLIMPYVSGTAKVTKPAS